MVRQPDCYSWIDSLVSYPPNFYLSYNILTNDVRFRCIICFTYVRFYYGLKHQGISRDDLPYKSWGQPWAAIAAGVMCFLITFFSGFSVFFPHNFSASAFLSNYIACFVTIAAYIILKLTIKSPWITYDMMEFSEMPAIREEAAYKAAHPEKKRPVWRRVLENFIDE